LGTTNRFLLKEKLYKSALTIAYVTGLTCKFWSYMTISNFPSVSKTLDAAMSPVWLVEFVINKATAQLCKMSPLKVPIPLNITREVESGAALTGDKLNYTFDFVKNMTKSLNT